MIHSRTPRHEQQSRGHRALLAVLTPQQPAHAVTSISAVAPAAAAVVEVGQHDVLEAEVVDLPVGSMQRPFAAGPTLSSAAASARPAAPCGRARGRVSHGGARSSSRWVAMHLVDVGGEHGAAASRTTRWSHTRSRSLTRWVESRTVSSVVGDSLGQRGQEVPPGQGIERGDRLVEQQHRRPLAEGEGQRDLGPLAAGEGADPLVERDAQRRRRSRAVASSQRGLSAAPIRRWSSASQRWYSGISWAR